MQRYDILLTKLRLSLKNMMLGLLIFAFVLQRARSAFCVVARVVFFPVSENYAPNHKTNRQGENNICNNFLHYTKRLPIWYTANADSHASSVVYSTVNHIHLRPASRLMAVTAAMQGK